REFFFCIEGDHGNVLFSGKLENWAIQAIVVAPAFEVFGSPEKLVFIDFASDVLVQNRLKSSLQVLDADCPTIRSGRLQTLDDFQLVEMIVQPVMVFTYEDGAFICQKANDSA